MLTSWSSAAVLGGFHARGCWPSTASRWLCASPTAFRGVPPTPGPCARPRCLACTTSSQGRRCTQVGRGSGAKGALPGSAALDSLLPLDTVPSPLHATATDMAGRGPGANPLAHVFQALDEPLELLEYKTWNVVLPEGQFLTEVGGEVAWLWLRGKPSLRRDLKRHALVLSLSPTCLALAAPPLCRWAPPSSSTCCSRSEGPRPRRSGANCSGSCSRWPRRRPCCRRWLSARTLGPC